MASYLTGCWGFVEGEVGREGGEGGEGGGREVDVPLTHPTHGTQTPHYSTCQLQLLYIIL